MPIHNKRATILYLIFCIGMAPLLTAGANVSEHAESMPGHCLDLSLSGDTSHGPCDNPQCMSAPGHCAAQVNAGYIPVLWWIRNFSNRFGNVLRPQTTRFRSHLEFSIFRPPIS
jgi:hypothetical protein